MDFLQFYIPVLTVCALYILYELCRKRQEDAPQRALPAAIVSACILPAAAIYAGSYAVSFCAYYAGTAAFVPAMAVIAGITLLTALSLCLLMNKLHIRRSMRILSAFLLLSAYAAELTAFGFSIAAKI